MVSAAVQRLLSRLPQAAASRAAQSCNASCSFSSTLFSSAHRTKHYGSQADDKPVYLVFGASGGIGSALSQRLVQGHYGPPGALVLSDASTDKLQQLQQLTGGSVPVELMPADATDPKAVDQLVNTVLQKYGRIDALTNCVGNVVAQSTLATDLSDLEAALRVNLYTSFNVVKSGVKAMLREEAQQHHAGAIVLVSAALASHGIANYEAMSAAKAGVEGLARSAAATYADKGIRVNCVAPGLTHTPQTKHFTDNARVEESSKKMHPMKHLMVPQDVAAALEFLMSRESRFITGQVLAVDGGLSTLHPHQARDYGV